MGEVAVVTDTTHYLPHELVAEHGLHEVSLYVNWAGGEDRESDLPGFDAFYDSMRSSTELARTSQPSVGDFLGVWEPLLDAGRDVVSVHLSGGISGTVESARQAAAQLAERGIDASRLRVVDSESACGGLGLVLLAAAAAARAGGNLAEVLSRIEEARRALKMWFLIDTLEFLRRGGRIGPAAAWLGSTLRIKPILTLEAQITPVERVRTSGRGFERLVEYLESRHEEGADAWVVQHIQASDQAERLVERGRAIFGSEPRFVSEVGPVIGAHVGPGLLGVGGLPPALVA